MDLEGEDEKSTTSAMPSHRWLLNSNKFGLFDETHEIGEGWCLNQEVSKLRTIVYSVL